MQPFANSSNMIAFCRMYVPPNFVASQSVILERLTNSGQPLEWILIHSKAISQTRHRNKFGAVPRQLNGRHTVEVSATLRRTINTPDPLREYSHAHEL